MALIPDNMRRWSLNYSRNHHWRVRSYCGLDDLMQDAALHFHRVSEIYPSAPLGKQCALFKTTFINHIHDLSKKASTGKFCSVMDMIRDPSQSEYDVWDSLIGHEDEQLTFLTGLLEMPPECRKALTIILSPEGAALLRKVYRLRSDGSRETLNERLKRLVKADRFVGDIPVIIRDHLRTMARPSYCQ